MSLFKNRTVVGVICILLSLLICFGVTPLFNQSVSQKTEIVRVVKEIKAGEEITKEMVQTAEVGGFGLPDNVLRQSESVVGKYATADLSVGDYILNTKLSDTPAAENTYLYNLDGTKQAMTIYLFLFGVLLSAGLFFIAADLLHLPTLATQKAMLSAGKQAKAKPKTTDALLRNAAVRLSRYIRMGRQQNQRRHQCGYQVQPWAWHRPL